ncbi:MAG: ABC transporter permease [Candidatus Accumulibacter sp.]|uniref:ABC transporter permease n=1 Tax=Accumulibacter sp. TaxID=2053492 RepID=UPI0019DC775A|nr:ABC transporter permease [Accumulibacter sp.]MBE2260678.1 ABC transporter permease [Paracoccaceae bacterium]MCB1940536.1 ABC transporter permease [Accumulibacter sp.]MCP5247662.1 ABC transporter permease [Accumulibacter sp.]
MRGSCFALPRPGLRWLPVWQRNFLVWRKLAFPSLLGNLADPLIYMLGLGYGLGGLLPAVQGVGYVQFLAAGTVVASTMNAATFEALYSAFSRMHVQKTWDAILNTPLSLDHVLTGELVWAASKSLLSGGAILLVVALLGLAASPLALWIVPLIFVTGLAFAALGLIVCALAPSYEFFMYYFTLFITPMLLLSGVFFPTERLPAVVQTIAGWLPLAHAVQLARPLLLGQLPDDALAHLAALLAIAGACFCIATALTRRRLLK